MTELEIQRVHQILVRLAFQIQELKENGEIQTQEAQKPTGSNVSDVETSRISSSKHARYIRQTINEEPSVEACAVRGDAN